MFTAITIVFHWILHISGGLIQYINERGWMKADGFGADRLDDLLDFVIKQVEFLGLVCKESFWHIRSWKVFLVVVSVYLMLNSNQIFFRFFLYVYLLEQSAQVGDRLEAKGVLVRNVRTRTRLNHHGRLKLPLDYSLAKQTAHIPRQWLGRACLCAFEDLGAGLAVGSFLEVLFLESEIRFRLLDRDGWVSFIRDRRL